MTDAEWKIVAPLIPPARRGGRPRAVDLREVLNGIFYVLSTGYQWQAMPTDLPPKRTVNHHFGLWEWNGTLARIHQPHCEAVREREGRTGRRSAAIRQTHQADGAFKRGSNSDPPE